MQSKSEPCIQSNSAPCSLPSTASDCLRSSPYSFVQTFKFQSEKKATQSREVDIFNPMYYKARTLSFLLSCPRRCLRLPPSLFFFVGFPLRQEVLAFLASQNSNLWNNTSQLRIRQSKKKTHVPVVFTLLLFTLGKRSIVALNRRTNQPAFSDSSPVD